MYNGVLKALRNSLKKKKVLNAFNPDSQTHWDLELSFKLFLQ